MKAPNKSRAAECFSPPKTRNIYRLWHLAVGHGTRGRPFHFDLCSTSLFGRPLGEFMTSTTHRSRCELPAWPFLICWSLLRHSFGLLRKNKSSIFSRGGCDELTTPGTSPKRARKARRAARSAFTSERQNTGPRFVRQCGTALLST